MHQRNKSFKSPTSRHETYGAEAVVATIYGVSNCAASHGAGGAAVATKMKSVCSVHYRHHIKPPQHLGSVWASLKGESPEPVRRVYLDINFPGLVKMHALSSSSGDGETLA